MVRIHKHEEKTSGGIIIPNQQKEDMAKEEGEIVAMGRSIFGEAYDDFRLDVKVGDIIAFPRYAGKTLGKDDKGNEMRVMRDVDILVVVGEE